MSDNDIQPFAKIAEPDGGLYAVRICMGVLNIALHCRRGLLPPSFSAPITLDEARELRDLFAGYVALQEAAGVVV